MPVLPPGAVPVLTKILLKGFAELLRNAISPGVAVVRAALPVAKMNSLVKCGLKT